MRLLDRHRAEDAMSISMVVLALVIVAMIMVYVGTQTLNSMYNVRKKSDRSVGMAAGDSAIEKVRVALQSGLADETDGFQLSEQDLIRLIDQQPNATVLRNSATSDAAGMAPVRVPGANAFTVREEGSDTVGYWQVYDVIAPRYLNTAPSDVVYYLRAWATAKGATSITTQPRVFRVEFRPSYMSDFQSVTDAPFFVKDNPDYQIDGPIHSNGYQVIDWLARDAGGVSRTGIWFEQAPTCTSRAAFSTSQNAGIHVPGGSCASAVARGSKNSRQISLLAAEDTYRRIAARCSAASVRCLSGATTYAVRLGNQSVQVNGASYPLAVGADSGSLTVMVDGDVTLSGALTMPAGRAGRVTIAAHRRTAGDRQPQVRITGPGAVGAADPAKDTVGVVTQGDVVLSIPPSCASAVNLATVSESGAVTIPPEYVTLAPPAVTLTGKACTSPTPFYGSFSAHGQFLASINWPDVRTGAKTPPVGYPSPVLRYNRNLFLNPPPFFPTALPWAVTKVKDADQRCLVPPNAGDPSCE